MEKNQAEPVMAGTQSTTFTNDQLLQALGCRMASEIEGDYIDTDTYKIILSSDLWTIYDNIGKIEALLEFNNETFDPECLHGVSAILWGTNGFGIINEDDEVCWGINDDCDNEDNIWRWGFCDWDEDTGHLSYSNEKHVSIYEKEFILIARK